MKTDKSNVNDKKEILVLPKGISWEGIIKAVNEEKGQQFLKKIDPETFKYILEESNHTEAIQSLLKTLKKIDPQNANEEYAEMTYGAMRKVSRIKI
jgi:Mg/Co/Ni transporter MgtE